MGLREREEEGERNINFVVLHIHAFIGSLLYALTWDQPATLVFQDNAPTQLSHLARALNLVEHYQTNEYWYLLLHPIFVKRFFRSGCLACDCTPHTNIFETLFVKFDIWATVYHEPVLTIKISSSTFNKAFTEWTARLRDLSCKIYD